jgi:hypothetical protein
LGYEAPNREILYFFRYYPNKEEESYLPLGSENAPPLFCSGFLFPPTPESDLENTLVARSSDERGS